MRRSKLQIVSSSTKAIEDDSKIDEDTEPQDELWVHVYNLRLYEDDHREYLVRVSFNSLDVLTNIIKPIGKDDICSRQPIAIGKMPFNPADYELMSKFADVPLVVQIQPYKSLVESPCESENYDQQTIEHEDSSCNIDILPLFANHDLKQMKIRQNLEPMQKPNVLHVKSWNLLPQIEMTVAIKRNDLNEPHHKVMKQANIMKISLIGAYNLLIPYDPEFSYTVATNIPVKRENVDVTIDKDPESNTNVVTFNDGKRMKRGFEYSKFYPKWETLNTAGELFTKCDEKMFFDLNNLQNNEKIDLKHYLKPSQYFCTTIWGSFHRYFILGDTNTWLAEHLRRYKWPLELHLYSERGGYSFMAYLDLFLLLYPGETTLNLAVPLQWIHPGEMLKNCGCELLLTPNEFGPMSSNGTNTPKKVGSAKLSEQNSTITDAGTFKPTGFDQGSAFVLVQVKLAKPFKDIVIPSPITQHEIDEMLTDCEKKIEKDSQKWECTGRGHLDKMWQQTVESATESLRSVPFYGKVEICSFNRQLSESRTRVELSTSFCQDAAIYVNNNFVVEDFLQSEDAYEELLRMSHACLLKLTSKCLLKPEEVSPINPIVRAARHARQLQDLNHAKTLYLQAVVECPREANNWRELATCYRDIDSDYACVCIDQSILLNPRHPLSLLSKAGMLFEEDPDAADVFFVAILNLYPFWTTGWLISCAYYYDREMYHMAGEIFKYLKLTMKTDLSPKPKDPGFPRSWEYELGDWWDKTPYLLGENPYYEATDLLLRLRAVALAEVCLARALAEDGETVQYYHLIALCCRLRQEYSDAICHLEAGIKKYGLMSYLVALKIECQHRENNCQPTLSELEKAGNNLAPYSTLMSLPGREHLKCRPILVDLIRRHPSAYAWLALADDWIKRAAVAEGGDAGLTMEQASAKDCAAACAVQALKLDRSAGRAWDLLAKLSKPRAKRIHCQEMAISCGFISDSSQLESTSSQQSACHYVGIPLLECVCEKYLKL